MSGYKSTQTIFAELCFALLFYAISAFLLIISVDLDENIFILHREPSKAPAFQGPISNQISARLGWCYCKESNFAPASYFHVMD